MADHENIGIAVGIALLARLGAEICTFHGCRPPSWTFHFRFHPSLVVQYKYMSNWYGRPRKHRYSRWNCISIRCGNGDNRFAVSTPNSFTDYSTPLHWVTDRQVWRLLAFYTITHIQGLACHVADNEHYLLPTYIPHNATSQTINTPKHNAFCKTMTDCIFIKMIVAHWWDCHRELCRKWTATSPQSETRHK